MKMKKGLLENIGFVVLSVAVAEMMSCKAVHAETAPSSLEGRRVLYIGSPDAAMVREFARTNRCEALVYPTREEAYRHHPAGAFAREY